MEFGEGEIAQIGPLDILFKTVEPSQFGVPGAGSACTIICLSVAYWLSSRKSEAETLCKMNLKELISHAVEVYDIWYEQQAGGVTHAFVMGIEAVEFNKKWNEYLRIRFSYEEMSGVVGLFDPVINEGVASSLEQLLGVIGVGSGAIVTFCHYSFLLWKFDGLWMIFDPHGLQTPEETSHVALIREARVACAELRQLHAMTSVRFQQSSEHMPEGFFSALILKNNKRR